MIHAPADPGADFKRCCMLGGHYDGSDRHYFFQAALGLVLTNEPVAENLSGKCFVTQRTVYIVNRSSGIPAPDELSTESGAGICPENPGLIGHIIHCGVKDKGDVPAGTEILVTKVTDKAMGESGRCWKVEGRFKDTRLDQADFEIPSCYSFSGSWLNEGQPAVTHLTGEKLFFKTDALKPCDSPAAP